MSSKAKDSIESMTTESLEVAQGTVHYQVISVVILILILYTGWDIKNTIISVEP